jgi:uncharacterized protein YdhG (YjbR/CyaY superfamily)
MTAKAKSTTKAKTKARSKAKAKAKAKATKASATRPTTVAAYIQAAPPAARARLREIRQCIRAELPEAKEEIKWRMPTYSQRRILVIFAAFKQHIGFFPTPSVVRAFAGELTGYKVGSNSIQFPLDQPLPVALIRRMTALRVKESAATDAKWRT